MMKKALPGLMLAALFSTHTAAAPQTAAPNADKAASSPAGKTASEPAAKTASDADSPDVHRPGLSNAATVPQIAATAFIVKDLQSNQVLAADNPDTPVEPASLTKMMTAYLVFKALEEGKIKPDDMLTVSDTGWHTEGSRMFLSPKIPVSVSDLLKGMIVQSGNDAAVTLAEAVGAAEAEPEQGSQAEKPKPPLENFVDMMNIEAKRLGMNRTRFNNPTGLTSERHLTTVADLSLLAAALIRDYPKYYPLFSLKSFQYRGVEQPNRNLLLFRDSSVDGLKTGHTESAGYNLAASSKRNGRRIVSIVVGTESTEARASESGKLLNWALQAFDTPKLYNAGEVISQVKVYKGSSNAVKIGFTDDTYITIPHGSGHRIRPILETEQPVLAPIEKGSVLGRLKIMNGSEVLAEKDVVALAAVGEDNWFGRTWDSIVLWFHQLFGGR